MKISIKNIQSIEEALFEIPDYGVVCFTGENSNGKSILTKLLDLITTRRFEDSEARFDLIRDGCDHGTFAIGLPNDYIISATIGLTNITSRLAIKRPNGETVVRNLRESGYLQLLSEVGFIVCTTSPLCMQIYRTYGLLPFVNSTPETNGEIVEVLTSDVIAESFINKFKNITHPVFKKEYQRLSNELDSAKIARKAVVLYDTRAYSELRNKITRLHGVLQYLEKIEIEKLQIVPSVETIQLDKPNLTQFNFQTPAPNIKPLQSLFNLISDMYDVRHGICPTCGQEINVQGCEIYA